MTPRRKSIDVDDDGAILVIVLVIITVIALVTLALLQYGLDQPKSTDALVARQRITAALDAGTSGAVENLRQGGSCSSTTVSDVDGLAQPITVVVTCAAQGSEFALTAHAFIPQTDCADTISPTSVTTSLATNVTVSGVAPAAEAEVSSWQLGTTTRCQSVPHG